MTVEKQRTSLWGDKSGGGKWKVSRVRLSRYFYAKDVLRRWLSNFNLLMLQYVLSSGDLGELSTSAFEKGAQIEVKGTKRLSTIHSPPYLCP